MMKALESKQPSLNSTSVLVTLALCMALQMTGFVMFLPLFARRFDDFGAGVEALGVSAMAFALTSTAAAPFMSALADRWGRRPIILLSLAAYTLAFAGYLFAATPVLLILLRGLTGIFTAGLVPAMMSAVGDLAPEDRRAQWLGIVNGGASFGWIGGPLLAGFLFDRYGYAVPFIAAIGMAGAAFVLAQARIPETKPDYPQQHQAFTGGTWRVLPQRSAFFLLLLIAIVVTCAWAFIEPQFMFYAYDHLLWSSTQLGMIMSFYGIAFMVGEFTLGRLSDRIGRKPVLLLGLVLFSTQFVGLLAFRQVGWIAVSFLLAGLGNALYDPALNAMIIDIAPADRKAGAIGLKSTAGSLGSLLGPVFIVIIAPVISPQAVFLIATIMVWILIAAVVGYFYASWRVRHVQRAPKATL